MLCHQKHPYVVKILEKSLQGSLHAQLYMAIKGPFGRFLFQPCTVSIKRRKNKFPTLRKYGIPLKASPDRRVRKRAWMHSNQRFQLIAVNATVHIGMFTKLGILERAAINRCSNRHLRMRLVLWDANFYMVLICEEYFAQCTICSHIYKLTGLPLFLQNEFLRIFHVFQDDFYTILVVTLGEIKRFHSSDFFFWYCIYIKKGNNFFFKFSKFVI